jgi:CRISPR/Cas system CMR-associated protein Cmr5 small subunit
MFDTIFVKKKLPLTKELKALDVKWEELDFQTKDLDNALDTYEITKSGKLRYLWQKREWKEDGESFLGGYYDVVEEEWKDVDFHGTINFYTSHCTNVTKHWDYLDDEDQLSFDNIELIHGDDWWFEFDASFTKGKLDSIKLIKAEKTPVKERIYNNKIWAMKRAEENKKLGRRVVNFLRKFSWYRISIRYILRFVNWLHSKLTRALYRM